ncbi:hypothetical protein BSCG_02735 [Bacteroides sp. 2_2_4]|nr:hypothetical protein BSCG_02735 [Bacteroides sp. 2_2_4]
MHSKGTSHSLRRITQPLLLRYNPEPLFRAENVFHRPEKKSYL